ncbi:MAG: hypothetical protein ACXVBW_08630, partial [Bdellovibrionota bacterium]
MKARYGIFLGLMVLVTAGWAWKPASSKSPDYVQRRPESETDSALAELQGFCEEFPKVANYKLTEYAILKDRAKNFPQSVGFNDRNQPASELYALSDFRAAHIPALRDTNRYIFELLISKGFTRSAKYFRHEVKSLFRGQSAPGFEEDLKHEIEQVFHVEEGSRCSNMFLQFFYANFLRQIEPMSDFGVDPESSVSKVSDSAAFELSPGVIELVIRRWQKTPAVDTELAQLDQAIAAAGAGARVLLDLRSADGADAALNGAIRERLSQAWSGARFSVTTDAFTQGDALILANEIAARESTLYARCLCRGPVTLDESLPPVVITLACGALGNSNGLAPDFHSAVSWTESEKILAELRKWPNP